MVDIKDKTEIKVEHLEDEVVLNEQTDVRSITGLFKTVSVVPTATPRNIFEQVVLYKSGSTRRLYVYNNIDNEWVKLTDTTVSKTGDSALEGDVTLTAGDGITITQSGQAITITNDNP